MTRRSVNLYITRRAEFELEAQFLWYELERRGLGLEFLREVEACCLRVRSNPVAYSRWSGDVRRAQIHRFPFTVLFSVERSSVAVLAVIHGRRHPRSWPTR